MFIRASLFPKPSQKWFAKSRKSVYHAAAEDYIQSGRAVCGRAIVRPAWQIDEDKTTGLFERCKGCAKRTEPVAIAVSVR